MIVSIVHISIRIGIFHLHTIQPHVSVYTRCLYFCITLKKKKKRNNKVRPSIKHYHARVIFKLTLEGRILYEYLHLLFLERKRKENFDFPRDSVRDRIEHTWMQVVRPGITRQQLFPRWDLRNPSCVTDESLSLFVSLRPSVSGFQVFSNKNRGRGRKQARVHTHVIHASKHGWCTRNPS